MSQDPRTTITPHLANGERLLWAVAADRGSIRRVAARDALRQAGFFGFIVAAVGLMTLTTPWLAEVGKSGVGAGTIFAIVVLGVSFYFGPWRAFSRPAALIGATYAITDRRLIVLRARDPIEMQSALLERVVCVDRLERADGSGDLLVYVAQPDAKTSTENTPLWLIGAPQVRAAEGLIVGRSGSSP